MEFADGFEQLASQRSADFLVGSVAVAQVTFSLLNVVLCAMLLLLALRLLSLLLFVGFWLASRILLTVEYLATMVDWVGRSVLRLTCTFLGRALSGPWAVFVLAAILWSEVAPLEGLLLLLVIQGLWEVALLSWSPITHVLVFVRDSWVWSVVVSPVWALVGLGFLWLPRLGRDGGEALGVGPWVPVDGCGQPVFNLSDEVGEEGEPPALHEVRMTPVSSIHCSRLRRRAVWVRRLECFLGGAPGGVGLFVRGRWTPDLPSPDLSAESNLALMHFRDGAKILGGGSVRSHEGRPVSYLVVLLADGSQELFVPELVGKLSTYALLRERDETLVSALRLRALEWCKGAGLSGPVTYWAVLCALRCSWEPSPQELRLSEWMAPRLSASTPPVGSG